MKGLIVAEFLRKVQTMPKLKKKLKILVGIGVVCLLLTGTLVVYVGVLGVKYVAGLGANVDVARHAEASKSQVENLPAVTTPDCLATAQGLFNLDKLLTTPLQDNFNSLKQACFEPAIQRPDTAKESELI